MIELENVYVKYPTGIEALKNVNIKIKDGEFVFIVGNSGSGKSTLIKIILKEIEPTKGNIYVDSIDISKLNKKQIPKYRRKFGVVFQNFRLLNDRNVFENVAFAQRIIGKPTKIIRRNVPIVLTMVGIKDKKKYKCFPKEMSGGEQQKIALARAVINEPKFLLADEPTGNLDPKNSREIMSLLDAINKSGTTVVVVTHNKEIVNEMQKRVITLKKGVIISDQEGGYLQ